MSRRNFKPCDCKWYKLKKKTRLNNIEIPAGLTNKPLKELVADLIKQKQAGGQKVAMPYQPFLWEIPSQTGEAVVLEFLSPKNIFDAIFMEKSGESTSWPLYILEL